MRARLPKKVLAFALCLALGVSSTLVAIADEEVPTGMVIAEPIADVSKGDTSDGYNQGGGVNLTDTVSSGNLTVSGSDMPAFTGEYADDQVAISVNAEAGVLPQGVELSVTPIVKQDVHDEMEEDEKAEVEAINAKYDETAGHLETETAEEEEVQAFLAYDISFLLNGTEIEPNGYVDVEMNFVNAVLPEGVSEETEIKVGHLAEEVETNGEAVLEDITPVASVITADDGLSVEKVKLTSDSFSVYVIYWTTGKNNSNYVYLRYVDTKGNVIYSGANEWKSFDAEDWVDLEELADPVKIQYNGKTYTYSKTQIGGSFDNAKSARYVRARKNNNKWSYSYKTSKNADAQNWSDSNKYIYIVYEGVTQLPPIETLDTSNYVSLNLFNYDRSINSSSNLDKYHFGFYNSSQDYTVDGKMTYSNDAAKKANVYHELKKGLVKKNLNQSGYPDLALTSGSLNFLFDPSSNADGVNYKPTNYLFRQDSDGYYYFNSKDNYARYDSTDERFYLYNYRVYPRYVEEGQFLPFNDVKGSEEGALYNIDDQNVDFWFGMSMGMSFSQPKNGQINSKDMVFEFSGDDDVWVFIDDILVLDMGGIRGTANGSINFATGALVNGSANNLRECYANAYREKKPYASESEVRAYLSNIFKGETSEFKDYLSHTLKFYYLERGAGASNCKLKFNMPLMPKNEIRVAKQITNINADVYSDIEFSFRVNVGNDYLKNRDYTIYKMDGSKVGNFTLGSDGIFKLRHNEYAIFDGITAGTEYSVTELGVESEKFDKVVINSTTTVTDNDSSAQGVTSPIYVAGETNAVTFQNSCSVYNQKNLKIQKHLENGLSGDVYAIQVRIGGELYNGDYYVGTNVTDSSTGTKVTAIDGIITLNADEEAVICDIPSDTSFEVEELPLDVTVYREPQYAATGASDIIINGKASGKLVFDSDAVVTVTNSMISAQNMLDYNKSASLVNWDDRTYDITLDASSKMSVVTPGSTVNVVLVLDGSGSMSFEMGKTTRKQAAADAVEAFVKGIANLSPNSMVGMVTYQSGYSNGREIIGLTKVSDLIADNYKALEEATEKYTGWVNGNSGGTYPSYGLNAAKKMLDNLSGDKNTKHVIMLCDGDSNEGGKTTTAANNVKSIATLHTVGFALGGSGSGTLNDLKNWATSEKHAHTADDQKALIKVFEDLVKDTIIIAPVTGVTVTDIIDARFELTSDAKAALLAEGASVTENSDGTTTIVWANQTINGKNGDAAGWIRVIRVKAKDDFMGGNMIPTNGEGSGITVKGTTLDFPKPTVNVKLLELSVADGEVTLFLGDDIETVTYLQELIDSIKAGTAQNSVLSSAQLEEVYNSLMNKKTATLDYSYGTTNDKVGRFEFSLTLEPVDTKIETHIAETAGQSVEVYTVKVTYIPDPISTRKTETAGKEYMEPSTDAGREVTGSKEAEGKYIVNVVSGQIQITKDLTGKRNAALEGDPVFTFKIEYRGKDNSSVVDTFYRTIRFTNGLVNSEDAEILKDLSRGYYTITELTSQKYDLDGISVNRATKCKYEQTGESVTFILGIDAEGNNSMEATSGKVTFTNKKTGPNTNTDTDVRLNRFVYENGKWVIESYTVPNDPVSDNQDKNTREQN